MFYVYIAVILGLVAIGGIVTAVFTTGRTPGAAATAVSLILLLLLTVFSSVTKVDARAVGIQTQFGQYKSTMGPGLHWTTPWSETEQFTTRLQPADLDGKGEGVAVTFLGGGSGTVNATFQWSISPDDGNQGARALWEKYKDFDTVRNDLVMKQARDVIINTANDFTPNDARTKQDVIGDKVKATLNNERLAKYGVSVDIVSITSMPLDARTQASLDKIVEAQNNVERARKENERATIDANTVKIRNAQGALSPEANQRFCLDVVNNWDHGKNGPLPATFNCALGGAGNPVIIGAK